MKKIKILINDITLKRKNQLIFEGLSCVLDQEKITVLLGYNGVGKTAFLRIVSGLTVPDQGSVQLLGAPSKLPLKVTMLFHKPVMLKRSVWSNLTYNLSRKTRDCDGFDEIIQDARIGHLLNRPAREISAGEQQRVALVRALFTTPNVLLLDEPTSNLDPFSVEVIEELIKKVNCQGIKIVMVTHNVNQAKRLGGEIIYLYNGKIVAQKTPDEFFDYSEENAWYSFLSGQEFIDV